MTTGILSQLCLRQVCISEGRAERGTARIDARGTISGPLLGFHMAEGSGIRGSCGKSRGSAWRCKDEEEGCEELEKARGSAHQAEWAD